MAVAREPLDRDHPDAVVLLQQVRLSTHRLLGATSRLGDVELLHPAASGLGTRRHVIARLIRHTRRITTSPDDDGVRRRVSDSLLQAPAIDLIDTLSTTLTTAMRRLDAQPSVRIPADESDGLCARDHLAWIELTHVDLGVGFEMHDIPEPARSAIVAHLERWTTTDAAAPAVGDSPFALLFASDDVSPRR